MRIPFVFSVFLLNLVPSLLNASTVHVPADQPTIQAAIAAASAGDVVLVAPGTYSENINFTGKAVTVKSSGGAKVTIIDGARIGPVATFNSGEGSKSILSGFTLQNGASTFNSGYDGGGVDVNGASPTIANNIIQNNTACSAGGGIALEFSSATVRNNVIQNNSQSGCSGGTGGGGINVGGAGSAVIVGNRIQNNSWGGNGGGISLFAAGTPLIENNFIAKNSAGSGGQGGGVWIVNDSDALFVQNLLVSNTANQGGAIYFLVPSGSTGPVLVNNTIVGGAGATQGSAVWAGGFDNLVLFYNNLMIGLSGQNAVYCDGSYNQTPPVFTNNDAYSVNGSGLLGTCAGESGQNGNISANPLFVGKSNFQLQSGSPAINAGDNSAPDIPSKDLAGKIRIVGGTIDIGAYEFQ